MMYNSSTVLAATLFVILIFDITPVSWGCSSTPAPRPYLLFTWVEPGNWATAATKCQIKNPGSRLATLNSKRMEYIQEKIGWDNITTSGEFSSPVRIWRARPSGDLDKSCSAISISFGDEEGSAPVVTWNKNEECKDLLEGLICEGTYTSSGSVVYPINCFGRHCEVMFDI